MLLTGSGSTLENLFKLIGLLVVFVIIIVACYYVTKLVGTRQLTMTKNSNFKILDSYRLGQNQIIAIIEVGRRYFCVGITKEQISLISELDEADFEKSGQKSIASFAGIFSSVLKKNEKKTCDDLKPDDSEETGTGSEDPSVDFSEEKPEAHSGEETGNEDQI